MNSSRQLAVIERMGAGFLSKIYMEWTTPWWGSSEDATVYLGGYVHVGYFRELGRGHKCLSW